MVYISNGEMQESQSPWRLSIFSEMFWGLINFIVLFFQTMVSPSKTKYGNSYTSEYKPGGDGGGGPRRRMGGFRGGRGAPNAPPMAGGG